MGNGKKKSRLAPLAMFSILALEVAALTALILRIDNFAIFNPKGLVAQEQLDLMLLSVVIMFAIAIPTVLLLYFFAWKYRESNKSATYDPAMRHGKLFNFSIWAIPSAFILAMALVLGPATHKLEPSQHISSANKPMTIQVVAMRWKWVFIYPEQRIATVNHLRIPTDTPVIFQLSADEAPMSSFWIPNLGGQLYAMTGHVNTLHLIADEPGAYPGSSAEINGPGFAGMKFVAQADSREGFDQWVANVKRSPGILDRSEYDKLLKPSEDHPRTSYAITQSDLFDNLLLKYTGSHKDEHTGHE